MIFLYYLGILNIQKLYLEFINTPDVKTRHIFFPLLPQLFLFSKLSISSTCPFLSSPLE